jgi:broad specificity phosphatase PhoE
MILLRHAQSEFNLHMTANRRDPGIVDPKLTPLGHRQAREAATRLQALGEPIRRIIVSPYTRALQTAAPIARALGAPVIVNPVVRERYGFVCDVGTPRSALARAWPEVDFSHIDDVWWPSDDEPAESIAARAALFRAEMAALPDWADTLVISHWGFILAMTGEKIANVEQRRCDPTLPAPEGLSWTH